MSDLISNNDKEAIVKESLFKFLKQFITAELSSIDDIVLNYVVSILEDVGEESGEDAFDVEAFSEMMTAYFPEFSSIASVDVCHWMFDLAASLREEQTTAQNDDKITLDQSINEMLSPLNISAPQKARTPRHSHTKSDASSSGSSVSSDSFIDSGDQETVQALVEMFPGVSELEIRHCLTIANDDITQATQVLLHRRETGQSLVSNSTLYQCSTKRTPSLADDEELKSRIIARYSYVDKDEYAKEHKPVAPKIEPKKLVRYRDNKIVSLKGERYTEVKSENAEEGAKKSTAVRQGKTY